MDERTLRALVEAGAVRTVRIIADGGEFRVEAETGGGSVTASTLRGALKTWRSLDATARWVRGLGIGSARLELSGWRPDQRRLGACRI